MKKELALGIIAVLLVTTPVFAAPGGKSEEAKNNHGMEVAAEKTATHESTEHVNLPIPITPTETQTTEEEAKNTMVATPSTKTPTPGKHGFGQLKMVVPQDKQVKGASVSAENCDPNAVWKNHGAYVSCVAKTHPGGQTVAEAARSDIGKKAVPSVPPTLSPTPPVTSPETEVTFAAHPFANFLKAIDRILHSLPFLPHNS